MEAMAERRSKVPQLESCCFVLSLRTGTLIIGIFSLVFSCIIFLVSFATSIYYLETEENSPYTFPFREKKESSILIFMETSSLITAILAIYLLIGVCNRKPEYIKTWVVIQFFSVLMYSIVTVLLTLIFILGGLHHFMAESIQILINFGLQTYSVLVIYSYYRDVRPGNIPSPSEVV